MTVSEAYAQAGVNIAAGNEAVERMKKHVAKTMRSEVIGGIGGFGGLFSLAQACRTMEHPVLVSGADGVGTKLDIAIAQNRHDTIGIDCVAMCVNDVLVQGAEPLFFLDYLAVGRLDPVQVEHIVAGVSQGCIQAGCALLGGETAEMPGMYEPGTYDIAGFSVGIVDRAHLIDGARIQSGDVLIGLSSSGLHSNGFSLVRHQIQKMQRTYDDIVWDGQTLGDVLLTPTRIYVRSVQAVLRERRFAVRGMAHITGGGLLENIPRILPEGCQARIQLDAWAMPPIFAWLQQGGHYTVADLYRTWNMGIGYVLVVEASAVADVCDLLHANGETPAVIGTIESGSSGVVLEGNAR